MYPEVLQWFQDKTIALNKVNQWSMAEIRTKMLTQEYLDKDWIVLRSKGRI